jgi:hypothetical protein
MGDRANIYVRPQFGEPAGVFLYSHWGGSSVCPAVQQALNRRARWGDGPYLTRMIFDALTGGDRGETGFGISCGIADNEHPIVIVDVGAQAVMLGTATVPPVPLDGLSWSFAEFAKLPLPEDGWPEGSTA